MLQRLALLSFILGLSVVSLDAAEGRPSLMALFGRMHVVVVHFPVALLMVLAVIETLRWRRREGSVDSTVVLLAIIAALSSIVAAIQGWIFAGPTRSDIELHRNHRGRGFYRPYCLNSATW